MSKTLTPEFPHGVFHQGKLYRLKTRTDAVNLRSLLDGSVLMRLKKRARYTQPHSAMFGFNFSALDPDEPIPFTVVSHPDSK